MQNEIEIKNIYPLLPAQRGLLVDSIAGEGEEYKQQICIELNNPISIDILESRIIKLVKHNELLRTIFDWSDETPAQVVVDGLETKINIFQDDMNKESISDLLSSEREQLNPVSDSPPIRFAIIKTQESILLVVTYHHILLDGPSVSILLDQLISGDFLPEVAANEYINWYNRNIGVSEYIVWKQFLENLDKDDGLLNGNIIDEVKKYKGSLSDFFYNKLINKSKEAKVTPAIFMQNLWSEWMMSYFNKNRFLFGLVVSTRIPNLSEHVLGPYISTIPWFVSSNTKSFNSKIKETSDRILDVEKAKHIPLGNIIKQVSPFAVNFDAILTINTNPVSHTDKYKVVDTYENTGYKLSVDIEISKTVDITFSTLLSDIGDALKSFLEYCEEQINESTQVTVSSRYSEVKENKKSTNIVIKDNDQILSSLASIFNVSKKNIDINISFLDMGGDSITALRFKSLLKKDDFNISIREILQSKSIMDMINSIGVDENRKDSNIKIDDYEMLIARSLFDGEVENVSRIPPPAKFIIDSYEYGYGQDYHEQTAFCLSGSINNSLMRDALEKMALEYPTLRLVYPPELPDLQILTPTPRVSIETRESSNESFDDFVKLVSKEYLNKPFDLTEGPLLRVVIHPKNNEEWHLFISFSALVTDGWSFSTMLKRLFSIYSELLDKSYTQEPSDYYIEYCKKSHNNSLNHDLIKRPASKNYSSDTWSNNFIIDKKITKKIIKKSNECHITISDFLLNMMTKSLENDNFSSIRVYENSRDDPESFSSVGPYSTLSRRPVQGSGDLEAYYVFENYPRESENNLRRGDIQSFNENGSWRRDLLPPTTAMGFLFDLIDGSIDVNLLLRKGRRKSDINKYWNKLISTINEEL